MLLTFILIVFLGRRFYKLADEYNKKAWPFVILGIVMYYVGQVILGLFIGLYFAYTNSFTDNVGIGLTYLAIPVGLAFCWGTYALLKRSWKKEQGFIQGDILDIGDEF